MTKKKRSVSILCIPRACPDSNLCNAKIHGQPWGCSHQIYATIMLHVIFTCQSSKLNCLVGVCMMKYFLPAKPKYFILN